MKGDPPRDGQLVPFGEEHLDACAELYAAVFGEPPWNEPWTIESARDRLSQIARTPESKGMVAVRDGRLMGMVLGYRRRQADGHLFFVDEMCVVADARGAGIGSALLQRFRQQLASEGVDHMILLTLRDTPAESFYLKNGFRRSSRTVLMVTDG